MVFWKVGSGDQSPCFLQNRNSSCHIPTFTVRFQASCRDAESVVSSFPTPPFPRYVKWTHSCIRKVQRRTKSVSLLAMMYCFITMDLKRHTSLNFSYHAPSPPFQTFRLPPQPYSQNSLPCGVDYCLVDPFYPLPIHMKRRSRSELSQALEVLDYEQGEEVGSRWARLHGQHRMRTVDWEMARESLQWSLCCSQWIR